MWRHEIWSDSTLTTVLTRFSYCLYHTSVTLYGPKILLLFDQELCTLEVCWLRLWYFLLKLQPDKTSARSHLYIWYYSTLYKNFWYKATVFKSDSLGILTNDYLHYDVQLPINHGMSIDSWNVLHLNIDKFLLLYFCDDTRNYKKKLNKIDLEI